MKALIRLDPLILGRLPLGLDWIATDVRLTRGAVVHTAVTLGGAA